MHKGKFHKKCKNDYDRSDRDNRQIASASGGIESIFALVYKRTRCPDNEEMYEVNLYFGKLAKEKVFIRRNFIDKILEMGSICGLKEIPEKIKKIFVT
jgi:ribonucleoside-diphosphate reductase alpha chain